jgi:aryl-alcohol dehydrogenase-like predicted oxidoreductase
MIPLCRDQGVGLIPWSPLARGRLARAPEEQATKRSETDRFGSVLYSSMAEADQRVLSAVDALAKARALSHANIALAWLLQKDPVTSPIVGATKMAHLETAVGALGVQLSPEDVAALEAAYLPHPVAGHS